MELEPSNTEQRHVALAPAVFVTGKGGVGKTLVATALARAAADEHGAAVYVEFGDGESGRRAFGPHRPGVEHVVLDPARAVVAAAAPLFGSRRVAKLALDNFAMRPLLEAAPAIRELAVLELCRKVIERHPGKRVVFDMPASGHSVAWLKVVREVRRVTAQGPLHAMCARVETELLSRDRASVVVVTLPERLVLSETLLLCDTIERDIGLSVDRLIVNRVPLPMPDAALADARQLSIAPGPHASAVESLVSCLGTRSAVRAEVLSALDATVHRADGRGDKGLTLLPLVHAEPHASTAASWLTDAEAA